MEAALGAGILEKTAESDASGERVSKLNLFFVSLVAAVPGGVLSYFLVTNFLTRADQMESMLQIVSAVTLALSALVTLLPFGILIFGPKTEEPEAPAKTEKEAAKSQAEVAVVEAPESEVVIPARDSAEFEVTDPEMGAFVGEEHFETEAEMPAFEADEEFQTEAELESVDFDEDFGDVFAYFDDLPRRRKGLTPLRSAVDGAGCKPTECLPWAS